MEEWRTAFSLGSQYGRKSVGDSADNEGERGDTMETRVITTGLMAGLVVVGWTSVSYGLVRIRDELGYKEVSHEETVLAGLDTSLTETGLYLVPGHSPPDSLFRERYSEGPLFRVHSLRRGAGGAPHVILPILALMVAPIIPTWLVWNLCRRGSPGFGMRFVVVALFGVFVALTTDLRLWGMELYPLGYSLLLAFGSVTTWLLAGLIVAWRIKPFIDRPSESM